MKDSGNRNWIVFFSLLMFTISAAIYYEQIQIFHNPRDTFFYLFQDIAFVPVQVILVSLFINALMARREKKLLLGKMNMVIGVFFSEVGSGLLARLASFDGNIDKIRARLLVTAGSSENDFRQIRESVAAHTPAIEIRSGSISALKEYLAPKRAFMVGLLENQNLLEHESFTEMLWAIFHMMEEFECRESLDGLPSADLKHLEGDMRRSYGLIMKEWLSYIEHLKKSYPYIFSLAVRMNPFAASASPVIHS
ncbi:MAG TPA: hypothetical protein PKY31_09685 [Spirochaetota bacterium]|nr:hypothetical protein [Spirochaetota bacterium]